MSNLPAFTGKTLIKALKKAGFEEMRIKAVIISYDIKTGDAPSFPSTAVRLLAENFFCRF